MSDSNRTGCKYCDFGDMEIMRNNGYFDEKYVFCELHGAVVEITENCPSCQINHYEEKHQANMNFLIDRMAEALENGDF